MLETRIIKLPKGGELELTLSPGFYDRVRLHFGMESTALVDDEHLRMFVFGAFKTAIDKADEEMLHDGRDTASAQ